MTQKTQKTTTPQKAQQTHRLIYGFHAITAYLRRAPDKIIELYVNDQRDDHRMRELLEQAQLEHCKITQYDTLRLDQMVGTRRHQGIIAKVSSQIGGIKFEDILQEIDQNSLFLILDGIQDPHNLGACLRVADAAGVTAVIAPKDRAVRLNATAIKVASGAADTVSYIEVTNLARTIRELKQAGVWVIGTAGEVEKDCYSVNQTGPIAWVLGSEGKGLRQLTRQVCDELVQIPMYGTVSSLNVSVASGICLFETCRQRLNVKKV